MPTSSHVNAFMTRVALRYSVHIYLETTLGLIKCLEISRELIRECVTVPGCCCCMPAMLWLILGGSQHYTFVMTAYTLCVCFVQ